MKVFALLLSLLFFIQGTLASALELGPPPAKGSAIYIQDYKILHQLQDSRTQEQCEAANRQTMPTTTNLFGPETGVLTAAELKSVVVESDQLLAKIVKLCSPFKGQYVRIRPYDADPTLHPCVKIPGGQRSYPSTHAAAGILLSKFIASKFPAKRDQILRQGMQIGLNRVLGGVHHPSDVTAGRSLGRQAAKELLEIE